eukprot:CAMPEP_0198679326 /NCGR_PEP_ID=MMETSP1468-20131203/2495_1 /TAXON_ID=1461545 /ORGANISM="Mantoniella sp, Strain CCMP1436" /LENGTH=83 /DNA_ID=CAMNT_0044417851 /DNA_START=134 /DNA_END=381 /DNA_ORIENTATION=+
MSTSPKNFSPSTSTACSARLTVGQMCSGTTNTTSPLLGGVDAPPFPASPAGLIAHGRCSSLHAIAVHSGRPSTYPAGSPASAA